MKNLFQTLTILSCLLLSTSGIFAQRGIGSNVIDVDYASPKQYEIGGIKATGVRFLDPNSLITITNLRVGDKITVPGDKLSSAIKKLWEQQILGDVKVVVTKVEGDYIFLEFQLKEKPRLSKFKFTGVRKSEADDIRESIRLIRGKVVTDAILANTKSKVEKYYTNKGYRKAEVNVIQRNDSSMVNSVILDIMVDKRERVKIDKIAFLGNNSMSDGKLKRKMKETKERKIYRLFKSSKLLPAAYAEDKQSVIGFYNSKGYRDASITLDTIYDVAENRLRINLEVDEGPEYRFGNITWEGNFLYSDDTLSKILNIKRGESYSKELLDKKLNFNPSGLDITSLYMDKGYLFFNIIPVEVRADSNQIDIEMRMYEGEQATIRNIIINGNTVTSDHVIRRELFTLPGQKFSRTALIRSQQALAGLGYFNNETMGLNPIPDPATGMVDIEYTVEEKPSNQITLSGGWGGIQGVVGTLGLVYTNFSARKILKLKEYSPLPSGDGQRLSIQGQANGRRYQNIALSFTEPWLGGRRPNSLTVSINRSILRQLQGWPTQEQVGAMFITGANVFLGRRLRKPDNYFQLTNAIGINNYKVEGLYPVPIVDGGKVTTATNASFNNLNFKTSLSRNSIDNPQFPRTGSQFSLDVAFTPPYSWLGRDVRNMSDVKDKYKWVEYHKWGLSFATHASLLPNTKKRRLVLKNSANIGLIGNYSKGVGSGPFERYVLGGTGMQGFGITSMLLGQDYIGLRGYQDNSPLLNQLVPFQNQNIPVGGIAYTKFTSELRFLFSDNPMATIYGIGFFEAGNNFHNYHEINPFQMRRSVGTGIRLFMPMFGGLLGFDIAFPLDRTDPRLPKFETHFSIGQ